MQVTMNHEQFGMPHSRRISDRAQARTRSDAKSPAVAPEIRGMRFSRKAECRRGFTLVEMLVVMVIIGLLAAMGMAALFGTLSIARRAATRSLIEKLNSGLEDRLRSLNNRVIEVLPIDRYLADGDPIRAQVIAKKRVMKEEFPQWFEVVSAGVNDLPDGYDIVGDWDPLYVQNGVVQRPAQVSPVARGYRTWVMNLAARDGNDNDGNGWADSDDSEEWKLSPSLLLERHNPRTTSAECLYLILTRGPGTSEIDEDSFTESEVGDTDGDGLLEFIDAFGNPIRFYRWPTHYRSPIQKGMAPYDTRLAPQPSERREDDRLDPNRSLVRPWGPNGQGTLLFREACSVTPNRLNSNGRGVWPAFHEVFDPIFCLSTSHIFSVSDWQSPFSVAYRWNAAFVPDNNKLSHEGVGVFRAYKTTPLIVSSGVDQLFGLVDPGDLPSGRKGMSLQARIIADQPEPVFRDHESDGTHLDNLTNHQQLGGS